MSTIDQKGPNSNPTNEPNGAVVGTPDDMSESASADAERGAIRASVEDDAAMAVHDDADEPTPRTGETVAGRPDESVPASAKRGLTALASLRGSLEARGLSRRLDGALSTLDAAIRNPRAGSTPGGTDDPPASTERRAKEHDDSDDADDEAPTSRMTPPEFSCFALRDDGTLLVSLEDAADRDLEGRTVIPFMVITGEEATHARRVMDFALSDAAANIIGALPMKVPS